jgi:FHIPEP family
MRGDWLLPLAAVGIVFVMLVPVPAILLDLLLAVSISLSVLVLLAALQILRPVQFSVFPTMLLLLTLFRLSLNLASTRRILLHGNEGTAAAGHVIESFGQFVVGGNYVVGFVVFLALIAIQYLVINHGAVRTAEVSARFTLDALPGKQMAIDADLNAGAIDEKTARSRRELITREAEFYGAMDGAARFSQRDSLATILITAINIIAGFLIGVFQLGMPFRDALATFTILTVGDGLVTLIPALLVSVAGGIVVTRATSDDAIGTQLAKQLFAKRRPLYIASGVMLSMVLIPGLPMIPFLLLSGSLAYLGSRIKDEKPEPLKEVEAAPKPAMQEQLETLLKLDEISVEVGYGLIPLVDQKQGGQMLPRIRALRRHLATELGFIVPAIHITDNMRLKPREYVLRLRGVEIARGETYQDWLLAISSEASPPPLEGIETREPAFGVPARWIPAKLRDMALGAGYAVVEQTSVIATHLAEVIRRSTHAPGNQASAGLARRNAAQAGGRTRSARAQPWRSRKDSAAAFARASLDSQPAGNSRDSDRRFGHKSQRDPAGGGRAPDAGARAGAAAATGRRKAESSGGGPCARRRNYPCLRSAVRGQPRARPANQFPAAHSGRLEARRGRAGHDRFARTALRQPRALSSAPSARALRSPNRGDFAGGNSRSRFGAVAGGSAMKRMPRQSALGRRAKIRRRHEAEERT